MESMLRRKKTKSVAKIIHIIVAPTGAMVFMKTESIVRSMSARLLGSRYEPF